MDGRTSFFQDALQLVLNRGLTLGLGVLSGVVVARCLGPEGKGIIAAVTVYPAMFMSFSQLGVRQAAVYYLGKGLLTERQVVGAVSTLILATGAVGVGGCILVLKATGNAAFTWPVVTLAVAVIPLTLAQSYSSGVFLGRRWVGLFARVQRMTVVQNFLFVIVLVWWLGVGVPGVLAASVMSSLFVAVYALKKVAEVAPLRPSFDLRVVRTLLGKGIAYAVALFVLALNYRVDIAMMERLSTAYEIGCYAVAVSLAQLAWDFPQSITTALFSHSATSESEDEFSVKVARLFRVTVIVSAVMSLAILVAAPIVIPLMYGPKFLRSVTALQLLLPGIFFFLPIKVLNTDLAGRGRPNASLWATLPALGVNVVLNLLLLPAYGGSGAAVASSISYSVAGLAFLVVYRNVTGMSLAELWRYRRQDFSFLKRLVPVR